MASRVRAWLLPTDTPLTFLILGLNVALAVLLAVQSGSIWGFDGFALFRAGANIQVYTLDDGQWWRLLTYASLHGGLLHVLFNMHALTVAGAFVERAFGAGRLAWLWVGSSVLGGLASAAFQMSLSVGASGALFGLMGAALVATWAAHHPAAKQIRNSLGITLALLVGYDLMTPGGVGIDHLAHAGGFVAGAAMTGWWVWRARRGAVQQPLWSRVLAYLALAVLLAAPLVRQVIVRDLPAQRGHTEAQQRAVQLQLWAPCKAALDAEAWADAVAPCTRFRDVVWERAFGYLLLADLYAIQGRDDDAARQRRILRVHAPDAVASEPLPPHLVLPLRVQQIEEFLRR